MTLPTTIPLRPPLAPVQAALALVTAGAAGLNLGFSLLVVPRLLESPPAVMLRQWRRALVAGRDLFVPTTVLLALAQAVVYLVRRRAASATALSTPASTFPLIAAGLAVAIVPYTVAVIAPTNRALLGRAAAIDKAEEAQEAQAEAAKATKTTTTTTTTTSATTADAASFSPTLTTQDIATSRYLVDHWGLLNLGRTLLLTASAVVGLAAAL